MTTPATLVLAGSGAGSSPSGETPVLGIPLARRAALSALRAGFERVYVLNGSAGTSVLEETGVRSFPRDGNGSALPPGLVVLLPDRVAASPDWMRRLREATLEPGRLYELGSGVVVEAVDPAPLSLALARESSLAAVEAAWAAALPRGGAAPNVVPPLEVRTEADLPRAEKLLLRGLVKKEDGLLTRLVSRKISLAVTRRLARTRLTPNGMTFVCLALGLAAAYSFASPTIARQLFGAVLFLLHSILDGCDGELARLKFSESRLGGVLDFLADNVVHVAVFSAFAIAWSAAVGESWPLILGVLAVTGTVAGAGFVYAYAMRPRTDAGPVLTTVSPSRRSRLSQTLDAVARRDFIYLVMVLGLFGKAYWFLALAAIGAPAFFLGVVAMAFVARTRRTAAAQ